MTGMAGPAPRMSYAEYLAFEEAAETKHDLVDGVVYAMAGGTIEHSRLANLVGAELTIALRGRSCTVYQADARVRVESTNRATYADVTVVCGPVETASDDAQAIANPVVIVEVLSPTTERSDRGEKLAHYRRLDSLREYVLVSQEEPRVEVFRRTDAGWLLREHGPGERVELPSLDVALDVDALYARPAVEA